MSYALKRANILEIRYRRYAIHFRVRDILFQMEVIVIRMLLSVKLLKSLS